MYPCLMYHIAHKVFPLKDQLTLCLIDVTDDADDISSDSRLGWLKHVNDTTYMFFFFFQWNWMFDAASKSRYQRIVMKN